MQLLYSPNQLHFPINISVATVASGLKSIVALAFREHLTVLIMTLNSVPNEEYLLGT